MPTPSEQKALAFFTIVILLGGAVRVLRAGPPTLPSHAEQAALATQANAAETAAVRARKPTSHISGAKLARSRRRSGVDTVGGVVGVPFSDVRPGSPAPSPSDYVPHGGWVNGFPPPASRIDIDNRSDVSIPVRPGSKLARGVAAHSEGAARIDADVATAAELEGLPRVGPALAARIIANRDSFGAFGSLEGLRRVRGFGPATLRLIAPAVTFSGHAASSVARSRY